MFNNKNKVKQVLEVPKFIILSGRLLQFFSVNLAAKFAQNLFITPIKFKPPKREREMFAKSVKSKITIPSVQKDIVVYQYGTNKKASKKALLIHGWNGRGTQLVSIANLLMRQGYDIISFDAPGHGKSPKNKTDLSEFIQAAFEVEKQFGYFDLVVGHSLGGMTTIHTIKNGLKTKKAVILGSGDVVEDVIEDFVKKIRLKPIVAKKIKNRFENQFNQNMQSYCVHLAVQEIDIPILIIHDEDDTDVPVKAAYQIKKNIKNGELLITQGLGHRKILGDKKVIEKIKSFIQSN